MIEIIITIITALVIIPFLFKYPEITFGLFLTAGFFKGDPRLQDFLPEFFDLTVFFGLIVVLSILCKILKKKLKISRIPNKLFLPYIILVFLMFVSLFYTEAPIYGWDKFLRFITITTLAIFGPLFLFKDIKKLHRFLYTLILVSSLTVIESIISYSGIDGDFRTAFGSDYLSLGRMAGVASLMIVYYFLTKNDELKIRFLWFLLFGLNFFGLLYGGGRAPVIAFFVMIIILGLFSLTPKIRINQAKIIKIAGGFILIGIMLFLLSPGLFSTLFDRINILFLQEKGGGSVAVRLNLYDSAIRAITENPIQGLGMGGFSFYHSGVDQRLHPHNILLEISTEIGIMGLISFLFLIGFCFFYLLKLRKIYKEQEKYYLITAILALFIFMFLNALVSGDINDNRLFFVWLGCAYSIRAILKIENTISKDANDVTNEKTI